MKWFSGTLLLVSFLAAFLGSAVQASDKVCAPIKYNYKLNKNATVRTDFYPAFDPQGAIVFIEGPEAKFDSSKSFIVSLCQRGFSIAAFNVEGKKINPQDYLKAATFVTKRMHKALPRASLLAYGWSKGSGIAVDLVQRHPKNFKRVILESPILTKGQSYELTRLKNIRVFACAEDSKEQISALKKISRRTKVYLTQWESCRHRLSSSDEIKGPLVDFIEGDFASGFTLHDSGFWKQL